MLAREPTGGDHESPSEEAPHDPEATDPGAADAGEATLDRVLLEKADGASSVKTSAELGERARNLAAEECANEGVFQSTRGDRGIVAA